MAARTHSQVLPITKGVDTAANALVTFTINGLSCSIIPRLPDTHPKEITESQSVIGHLSVNDHDYVIVQIGRKNDSGIQKRLVDTLSKRELQIVVLVAEGKVNKQIADSLKISEWTVSTYLRRIFAKLGVDSRAAMVFKCSRFLHHDKCETK
jgi:DNA-binding CsgD family transcriptional regulator